VNHLPVLFSGKIVKMITSAQNPKIQKIRLLITQSKERKKTNQFVIEGVRLCEEAMNADWEFEYVLFSDNLSERGRDIITQAINKNIPIDEIPFSLMKKIAGTENPQGIICVLDQKHPVLPERPDFVLICDSIKDPGNLGTILRSANAAQAQAVLVSPNSTDIFSPKVMRAGMGAHFHLPILQFDWDEIEEICKNPFHSMKTIIASANATTTLWQLDLIQPTAIIIGSEATGPCPEAQQLADQLIKIPMPGSSESLNAAIAASIILFEVVRQRWK
jgi:TrmH family RNA methyltransferase